VTGKDVKRIREALGLSQRQFAERLRVHTVTVAKWEAEMQGMRGPAEHLIELLGQSAGVPAPRKNPRRRNKPVRATSKNRKTTR
jgi:transcriptional regulator with XRE-family HTH domain